VLNPNPDEELVNTREGFDRVMSSFQFRGLTDSTSYFSDDYRRAVQNHRNSLNKLAIGLLQEGDTGKARKVIDLSLEKMPDKALRYDVSSLETIQILFALGERERAIELADTMKQRSYDVAKYYLAEQRFGSDLKLNVAILGEVARIYLYHKESGRADEVERLYAELANAASNRSDM
jgi:hypothetical protein